MGKNTIEVKINTFGTMKHPRGDLSIIMYFVVEF